jgi:hypothetical protein
MNSYTSNYQHQTTKSPWLDPTHSSQFSDQFRLIEDIKIQPEIQNGNPYFEPLEIFKWIDKNKAVDKFFKALAKFAPMYPVVAYNGGIASWISPPPSGSCNVVWIVMGRDKTRKLRVCGTNICFRPWVTSATELSASDFFEQYDELTTDREKEELFSKVFSIAYRQIGKEYIRCVTRRCEIFNTMPIFITVLSATGSMAQIAEAVIEGDSPSDFSYEFTGEI